MNHVKKIFGDRYLPHMTTNVAESHMNTLSISKDLIKQTYHNEPPLKDGCIQSLDWTGGLDYWTQVFSLFKQIFGQLVVSMLVSCS